MTRSQWEDISGETWQDGNKSGTVLYQLFSRCVCVFQSLVSSLVIDQPDDPLSYLINLLQRSSVDSKTNTVLIPPSSVVFKCWLISDQFEWWMKPCFLLLLPLGGAVTLQPTVCCSCYYHILSWAFNIFMVWTVSLSVPRIILLGPPAVGKHTVVSLHVKNTWRSTDANSHWGREPDWTVVLGCVYVLSVLLWWLLSSCCRPSGHEAERWAESCSCDRRQFTAGPIRAECTGTPVHTHTAGTHTHTMSVDEFLIAVCVTVVMLCVVVCPLCTQVWLPGQMKTPLSVCDRRGGSHDRFTLCLCVQELPAELLLKLTQQRLTEVDCFNRVSSLHLSGC